MIMIVKLKMTRPIPVTRRDLKEQKEEARLPHSIVSVSDRRQLLNGLRCTKELVLQNHVAETATMLCDGVAKICR